MAHPGISSKNNFTIPAVGINLTSSLSVKTINESQHL